VTAWTAPIRPRGDRELLDDVAELEDELRRAIGPAGGHRDLRLGDGLEQLELLPERRHQGLVLLGFGDQLGAEVAEVARR
jgi:hypothetical protein